MNTQPTTPTNQHITFAQYNAAERNAELASILANARTVLNLQSFIEDERHLLGRTVEGIQRSNALNRAELILESLQQSLQQPISKSKRKLEFVFFNTDGGNNNLKRPPRRDDDDNNDSLTNAIRCVNIAY